ncbi:MAG: pseudouridine-5-phosphate glycosidase [Rhodobacteraceae bacterium]|nr:pseudouridine-5-phosphate glycosidase [Paracoccaceae bacterium]
MKNITLESELKIGSEVSAALDSGTPVIALESNVIAHGLPFPQNLETLVQMENAIRSAGAVPATIAVLDGKILVGLEASQIHYFATTPGLAKVSSRDLPIVLATKESAVTTVAASLVAAELAGIKFFASAGLGGVHRAAGSTFDISSDLIQIARSNVIAVTAGVKKILDIGLTLEFLETHCIPCVTYQFDDFPAFYVRSSGFKSPCRMDSLLEISEAIDIHRTIGKGGFIVAAPIDEVDAIDEAVVEAAIVDASAQATRENVYGKGLTKFVMRSVNKATAGKSDAANAAVLISNARLAAELAVIHSARATNPSLTSIDRRIT